MISVFALTVLLLLTSLPMTTLAQTALAAAEEEQALLEEIDAMLAVERVPGEIVFFMEDGITVEEAKKILGDIGMPNDFEDRSMYTYRSFDDDFSEVLWFTVRLPEMQLRSTLLELRSCKDISAAFVNGLVYSAGIAEELEDIDDMVEAEANAPLEDYDPLTTSTAMSKMGDAEAWKYGFSGSASIVVAVLDSGYNAHTDVSCVNMSLATNVITEIRTNDVTDNNGHGSFIVGQIGASLNGSGVNGICKSITIVPVKMAEHDSATGRATASYSAVVRAMKYAEEIGADIVNYSYTMSIGLFDYIESENAVFSGLFVAAAGNDGEEILLDRDDIDGGNGSCDGYANGLSNWVVVGNSTLSDTKAVSSNYSKVYVDLFAPGTEIRGIASDGSGTEISGGTSMAAPHVAAAAALIMSKATHLSPVEVKQLLMDTVTPLDGFDEWCVSGGRLDIASAVRALYNAERPAYSRGDVNGDGELNAKDYMILKRMVLGTYTGTDEQKSAGDVNDDGEVNAKDYMILKRSILQLFYIVP